MRPGRRSAGTVFDSGSRVPATRWSSVRRVSMATIVTYENPLMVCEWAILLYMRGGPPAAPSGIAVQTPSPGLAVRSRKGEKAGGGKGTAGAGAGTDTGADTGAD